MSFVKDDHDYTRGVGAVAAMDAVSSARRRAAARAAVEMARRDAVMSRHTLGRISQTSTNGGGGGGTVTGGGGRPGTPRPPGRTPVFPPGRPRPPGKPLPPKPVPPRPLPFRPRGLDVASVAIKEKLQVKSPGSVLPPPPPAPTKADVVAEKTPVKAPVTIVAGGSGTSWTSGAGAKTPVAPIDMGPPMPEITDMPPEAPAPTSAPPTSKPKGGLLLYAALGIGAWWLLTRK